MTDSSDHLLERYLKGQRRPCPQCKYDLRDLTFEDGRPQCPECGTYLRLQVSLEKAYGPPAERTARLQRVEGWLVRFSLVLCVVLTLFVAWVLLARFL